tara:strand:+ start:483 stop:728 length:246 start_codon:yes stop_codon:yes gene_type:complete
MSSEVHKYVETALKKRERILSAKVLNFPNEENKLDFKDFENKSYDFWKISDKSNIDQLKAVTGICFMIGILIIAGLYSSLV